MKTKKALDDLEVVVPLKYVRTRHIVVATYKSGIYLQVSGQESVWLDAGSAERLGRTFKDVARRRRALDAAAKKTRRSR